MYKKLLKVARADGKRIEANVYPLADNTVTIKVDFLEEVMEDKPAFSYDGKIVITVKKMLYADTIVILESYLENLFLKGLADEDVNTSTGADADSGRNESEDIKRETDSDEGEGDTASIHSSPRRTEQTKSSRRRYKTHSVDKGSSAEAGSED